MTPIDRRRFLHGMAFAPAVACFAVPARTAGAASAPTRQAAPHFPRQDPALVREVVGASHRDLERVRTLVEARPALARATWDWGFGDWESALGAASHVGRPDIARFLMAHGARPDLFTWAMLGSVEAVRATVEGSPGVEAIPGPHGITLLAHARAGREDAALVVEYLESLGTADPRPRSLPLTAEEVAAMVGTYAYGADATERIVVDERNGSLQITAADGVARGLLRQSELEFHPVGVPSVRVRFTLSEERATSLTIGDADAILEATRAG